MKFFKHIIFNAALGAAVLLAGCSNTKNTMSRRAYHNLTSHYNVYFNASQYYIEGVQKIESELMCDYTEILPVFKVDAPGAADLARSDMESCIQKCGKNILTHSITSKPKSIMDVVEWIKASLNFTTNPIFANGLMIPIC